MTTELIPYPGDGVVCRMPDGRWVRGLVLVTYGPDRKCKVETRTPSLRSESLFKWEDLRVIALGPAPFADPGQDELRAAFAAQVAAIVERNRVGDMTPWECDEEPPLL